MPVSKAMCGMGIYSKQTLLQWQCPFPPHCYAQLNSTYFLMPLYLRTMTDTCTRLLSTYAAIENSQIWSFLHASVKGYVWNGNVL